MAGSTEQAIRVTARGEFGQLQRGLKDLQGDLKSVLGEIDKGARKGGIFDDTSLRALEVYRRRFGDTMEELNRELDRQTDSIDNLYNKMKKAYAWEQDELRKQIADRAKIVDGIRDEMDTLDKLYQKRMQEASNYGRAQTPNSVPSVGNRGTGDTGGSFVTSAMGKVSGGLGGALGALGTLGKFALGLAGAGSILGLGQQAYQLAYQKQVGSLDLAQRIRGYGFGGSASSIYEQSSTIGRQSNMGYTAPESWALQEAYTSRAGALGVNGQYSLQKFARGYGLDASEVGSAVGGVRQLGGVSHPKQFADMIASSVSQSGMLPRIKEVMEAHTGLLQNLNTTFKDGASQQILAYQTTLDRLGTQSGMTRLTGQQGANVIGGLAGIFQPGQEKWQWMGLSALKRYDPKKYGSMGLVDLMEQFQQGVENPDNVPAMAKYLRDSAGGNNDAFHLFMQQWLKDGGFNASLGQVKELDKVTNGFTAFDKDKLAKVLGTDSGAKYDTERKGEAGQGYLQNEANFQEALEKAGDKFLPIIQDLKKDIAGIINAVTSGDGDVVKVGREILNFLKDSGLDKFIEVIMGLKLAKWSVNKGLEVWNKGRKARGLPEAEAEGGGTGANKSAGKDERQIGDKATSSSEDTKSTGSFREQMEQKYPRLPNETEEAWIERTRLGEVNEINASKLEEVRRGTPLNEVMDKYNGRLAEINDAEGYTTKFGEPALPSGESGAKGGGIFSKLGKISKFSAIREGGNLGAFLGLDYFMNHGYEKFFGYKPGDIDWEETNKRPNNTGYAYHTGGKEGLVPSAIRSIGDKLSPTNFEDTKILQDFADKGELALDGLSTYGRQQLEQLQSQGLLKFQDLGTSTATTLTGMSDQGKASLLALQKDGLIAIGGLQTDGTAKITALNDEGKKALDDLNKQGQISITDFQKDGKLKITSLSTDGAKHLLELQKGGSLTLESMSGDTKSKMESVRKANVDTMDKITAEHKGFGDVIQKFGAWVNQISSIKGFKAWSSGEYWYDEGKKAYVNKDGKTFSEAGQGDSGAGLLGEVTADRDVRNISGVTAADLDLKLGGKLTGHGQDFIDAGNKYGIDPAFLAAISMSETGNGGQLLPGNNVAGMIGMRFGSVQEGIMGEAKNLNDLYISQGLTTPQAIQRKWAPLGAANDPTNLNANWLPNVLKFYKGFNGVGDSSGFGSGIFGMLASLFGLGGLTGGGSLTGGGNFFKNWQGRITDTFGSWRGDHGHTGLDIDGTQGDILNALAGGKLEFLDMDDGSANDSDRTKNTRMGGTEIGIRMPNGKLYSYSHLSEVNPEILQRWFSGDRNIDINEGDYIGNLGGDVGMAGSGYSTTGSHLHLGYKNANNGYLDPREFLNSLNQGDSDISGTMPAQPSEVKVSVDVNLKGEGVSQLNSMTVASLKQLISQTVAEIERQRLAMNSTVVGVVR